MLEEFSFPLSSGMRPLPPAEQEVHRQAHRDMIKRLLPFIEECDYLRRRAEVESRTAFIG